MTHRLAWILGAALLVFGLPVVFGPYGYYLGAALCVWAIFALAYDVAFGHAGLVSFGHAMFFGLGAYGLALPVLHWRWSFWSALGLSLAICALFAVLTGVVAVAVRGHSFVIITIIFSAVVELAALSQIWITRGEDGLSFTLDNIGLGLWRLPVVDPSTRYHFFFVVLGAVFFVVRAVTRSPLGRSFRAIRDNELRAALLGYPVHRYKLAAFTISGTLSGLAGALFTLLNFHVSAELFHITLSVNPLTAVLVGGAGTSAGPIVGAVVVFLLHDTLRTYFVYADFVIGAVLVGTVLFAPAGLTGLLDRAAAGRHRALQASVAGDDADRVAPVSSPRARR